MFGGFGVQNVLFPGLRLELEGLFANNGLDDFDNLQTRTVGGFGNLLYQIKLGPVQPYVGGGAGWGSSRVELDDDAGEIGFNDGDPNVSDGGFMWQVKAGFAVPLGRNLTIDIGYRYFNGAEIEDVAVFDPLTNVTANSNLDPAVHAINLGLRFRFGAGEAGPVRRYRAANDCAGAARRGHCPTGGPLLAAAGVAVFPAPHPRPIFVTPDSEGCAWD